MSRPWMPLYVGDFLRDTRHLTTTQIGAYMLLLMHYWSAGSLPKDVPSLRRITVQDRHQWRRNAPVISAFFSPDWRHERMEKELEKAKQISLKRQVYGAVGGRISRGRNNIERFQVVHPFPSKS